MITGRKCNEQLGLVTIRMHAVRRTVTPWGPPIPPGGPPGTPGPGRTTRGSVLRRRRDTTPQKPLFGIRCSTKRGGSWVVQRPLSQLRSLTDGQGRRGITRKSQPGRSDLHLSDNLILRLAMMRWHSSSKAKGTTAGPLKGRTHDAITGLGPTDLPGTAEDNGEAS